MGFPLELPLFGAVFFVRGWLPVFLFHFSFFRTGSEFMRNAGFCNLNLPVLFGFSWVAGVSVHGWLEM